MNKYFGDKKFYRELIAIMIPILIQSVITNFVNLLDNIMVGQLGTEPMSGVAITNQLLFVFNISTFGGLSGAGIFTAQYFGKQDNDGIRNSIRCKVWIAFIILIITFGIFIFFGKNLIMSFIHQGNELLDLEKTYNYAYTYLKIMYIQLPLMAFSTLYATSLRECGETKLPLKASLAAVVTNLIFNYFLIFGKCGFPKLEVVGAAIATVLSRIVELFVLAKHSLSSKDKYPFFNGLYSSLRVPSVLVKDIAKAGAPLLINEFLWSSGMATLYQIFSLLGLEVVSAENICNTVSDLFFCSFFAMGTTISIVIGQLLGAGETKKAIDYDTKYITFSVLFCTAVGLIMIVLAKYIPLLYKTSAGIRSLASSFIIITAIMMPSNAFTNACYFTLRSGGKVWITLLFDSIYLWILSIPLTFFLITYTSLPTVYIYAISYGIDLLKCIIGYILVHNRTWVVNLVKEI